jgi:type VI protein secretion system component VasK
MQDVLQLPREWVARDRALRRRQTRQTIGVALAAVVLAVLPALIWINLPEAG